MRLASMAFPILRFNDSHLMRFKSASDLQRTTQKYFSRGQFWRNASIIDSTGKKYSIENVQKVRRSWHIGYWLAPSPAIIVDYEIGQPIQLSIDEIKSLIIDLVVKNHWYTQGQESEDQFREAFAQMRSISELMANVSFYGKWQG